MKNKYFTRFKNTVIIMTSNIGAEHINFSEDQKSKIEVFTKEKVYEEIILFLEKS